MRFGRFLLVAGLQSLAQANDITFYLFSNCDNSVLFGCERIPAGVCCFDPSGLGAGAISISKGPIDFATMWSGGGCKKQECSAGGAGTFCCFVQGTFADQLTGGFWVSLPTRKREDPQSALNCTGTQEVNFFGYATGANTAWKIHQEHVGEDFAELRREFHTVPSDQQEAWLQANNAVYHDRLHDSPPVLGYASADHGA